VRTYSPNVESSSRQSLVDSASQPFRAHSAARAAYLFAPPAGRRPAGSPKSQTLAPVLSASRSTISSPRRKISTSLPLNRNSFGKRTAWLLPDRNTRVAMTSLFLSCVRLFAGHSMPGTHWRVAAPLLGSRP